MKTFVKDVLSYLDLYVLGHDGKAVTELTISYFIYKCSTNDLVATGTMSNTNGIYHAPVDIAETGQYKAIFYLPAEYEDGEEMFMVVDEPAKEESVQAILDDTEALAGSLTTIINSLTTHRGLTEDKLSRILGLVQENFRSFDHTYDVDGNLVSSTIKIYPSATDCTNDTNPIATYSVTATYGIGRKLLTYKVVKA